VLSGRGLCDELITRLGEYYRLWRVVVCDQETSNTRRLKPATGLWKIQPLWVVTPGKQQQQLNNYIVIHYAQLERQNWNTKYRLSVISQKMSSPRMCCRTYRLSN